MSRFFIIGDIHACPRELEAMLEALALKPKDHVVFLGDYVDRGPGAREVIELLLGLQADAVCGLTFLKGNHEDMFLSYLGYEGLYGEAFLMNGGVQTLESYGCDPHQPDFEKERLLESLPSKHLQFLRSLELSFPDDEVFCVHAGIDPLQSLEAQRPENLLWIRQEFINNPHLLPYTVVYGHTPQREVRFDLPYKVGIDTGLVYGGRLSCLEWTEKTLFQIGRGSVKVRTLDVQKYWCQL